MASKPTFSSANGYTAIKDNNGNNICTVSSIEQNKNVLMTYLLSPNGNFNINTTNNKINGSIQVPICTDDEIYRIQEVILKKLNAFNLEYSNYQIFQFNQQHNVAGDATTKRNYLQENGDRIPYTPSTQTSYESIYTNIQNPVNLPTYVDLNKDLTTYKNILKANQIYNHNPGDVSLMSNPDYYTPGATPDAEPVVNPKYINNPNSDLVNRDPTDYLTPKHRDITKIRSELDNKLMELNTIQNSMYGSSKLNMDSGIYISILWTTLASALVYYTFVHL
jgi:hypothetical protein